MKSYTLIMQVFLVVVSIVSAQLKPSLGGRIIGGSAAKAAQFPYSASITITTSEGKYFCSGALIENSWILTAGQCVEGVTSFAIRLGSNSLTTSDSNAVRVVTDTYFLHPDFNPATLENDIGLVKFHLPVTYTEYIQPINYLADVTLPVGSMVTAIGWGQISDEAAGIVDHLNYVDITTISNEECRLTYGSQISENMLCAEGNYNEGICLGDIGTPLIQYGSRGIAYHVGISSFFSSNGCESTNPSGFTRTADYRDWIRNVTNNN